MFTSRLGDVIEPFNPPEDSAQPNLADVLAIVRKWKGFDDPIKARSQLQPGLLNPMNGVNITDVFTAVQSWQGFSYPFEITTQCP